VQIKMSEVHNLHNILGNISMAKRHRMRRTIGRIWRAPPRPPRVVHVSSRC